MGLGAVAFVGVTNLYGRHSTGHSHVPPAMEDVERMIATSIITLGCGPAALLRILRVWKVRLDSRGSAFCPGDHAQCWQLSGGPALLSRAGLFVGWAAAPLSGVFGLPFVGRMHFSIAFHQLGQQSVCGFLGHADVVSSSWGWRRDFCVCTWGWCRDFCVCTFPVVSRP